MKLDSLLAGMIAGTLATAPMSLWMLGLARALPASERESLSPERVTVRTAPKSGLAGAADEPAERTPLTIVAHFGYGGAAGALYGLLADTLPGPKPLSGALYGIALWTGSYLGWLPAAGLHPASEPASRNLLNISAHLVWGVTLGGIHSMLAEPGAASRPASAAVPRRLALVR